MKNNWKPLVRAMLAVIVAVPTIALLFYHAVNESEWAIGVLVALLIAVLGFYGFKVRRDSGK